MKFACPKCSTRYSISDDKVPRGKVVRFSCKTCGNTIRLRRKDPTGDRPAAAGGRRPSEKDRQQAPDVASTRAPSQGAAAELREAAVPPARESERSSTRAVAANALERLRAESARGDDPGQGGSGATASTRVVAANALERLRAESARGDDPGEGGSGATASTRVVAANALERLRAESVRGARAPSSTPPGPGTETEEWYALVAGEQRGPIPASSLEAMLRRRDIDERTYVWRDGMAEWQRLASVRELTDLVSRVDEAARPAVAPAEEGLIAPPAGSDADSAGALEKHAAAGTLGPGARLFERDAEPGWAGSGADPEAHVAEPGLSPREQQPPGDAAAGDALSATAMAAASGAGVSYDGGYFAAPPGDSTRVFMAAGGLYRRRRNQRVAAVAGAVAAVLLVGIVSLDILGFITIPGMGMVYDMTGLTDPNTERAVNRVEAKLDKRNLDPEDRARLEALRRKLIGAAAPAAGRTAGPRPSARRSNAPGQATRGTGGHETLNDTERSLAAQIFASTDKRETRIKLADAEAIQAPKLPNGLTQRAIFAVITEGSRSMSLCLTEAMRKGEKLQGKMEIELTIQPDGSVSEVHTATPQLKGSVMASCAERRIKSWKFPAFNGEPVTVIYPYLLQMGI